MKKKFISVSLLLLLVTSFILEAWNWGQTVKGSEVKVFTAFFDTKGQNRDRDNEIKVRIAELTGAECEETWISGSTAENAANGYIAGGDYPDFISGGQEYYEAGALVPIDAYWEDYPNIYNYMSQNEWDRFRLSDGHIYWIPQFGVGNGAGSETIHEGEAFWIQTRVLKWAGYPRIDTLDKYFALLEAYMADNPILDEHTQNIPYTILCDDWRYFCLENVPQFLDGYPNDGCCMVDPETQQVADYNMTSTAEQYFRKLNEEYKKGMIDPESFTSTYEEYIEKLSTGAVLGMVDQWWDFAYDITAAYDRQGLEDMGCDYVPLPITLNGETVNQWHVKRTNELDTSSGISITTSCRDIEGAMKFMNDLLDPDIQNLRFWGMEGKDYSVDQNGQFYRTDAQRKRADNEDLIASHYCSYSYFPRREGIEPDGINAFAPEYQKQEFYLSLPKDVKDCLDAYGCSSYVDMLGTCEQPGKWYPLYSYSDQLTYSSKEGRVWKQMGETKHLWLPRVVMADDFQSTWDAYQKAYEACQPEIFFFSVQSELYKRVNESD